MSVHGAVVDFFVNCLSPLTHIGEGFHGGIDWVHAIGACVVFASDVIKPLAPRITAGIAALSLTGFLGTLAGFGINLIPPDAEGFYQILAFCGTVALLSCVMLFLQRGHTNGAIAQLIPAIAGLQKTLLSLEKAQEDQKETLDRIKTNQEEQKNTLKKITKDQDKMMEFLRQEVIKKFEEIQVSLAPNQSRLPLETPRSEHVAKKTPIFMSYTTEDQEIAKQIYRALTAANYKVFAYFSMPAGGNWQEQIKRAIDEAASYGFFLLLTSPAYFMNPLARAELIAALKISHNPNIVPIIVRDNQETLAYLPRIPREVQMIQFFDLSSGQFDERMKQLIAILRAKENRRP